MTEEEKEIRGWRKLYPEISKDGLWQLAPKYYDGDQLLKAIRSIDSLLNLLDQEREKVRKLREGIRRHEVFIREEFGHAITEADEALWKLIEGK